MAVEVDVKGVTVREAGDDALERWNGLVERSPQGTVFHRLEFLETVADHASAELVPLVGFKGQEPVGVFPLFTRTYGFVTAAFSPPPGMGLSQLGPAMLNLGSLKRRTAEKRTRRFTEAALQWLDDAVGPRYVNVRTHRRHPDHRPFGWGGFELTPRYTYVLDLTMGEDEILAAASSDARRNVRKTEESEYEIVEGGVDDVERVIRHLRRRHSEQDIDYPVTADFVTDLYRRLPDDCVTAYRCTVDGRYASGMIALADDETIYRWQGGARPPRDIDVPINDLLDWRLVTDGIEAGRDRYDLVGANTPALCEYKSKFGPELATYHAMERGSRAATLASSLYRQFK